MPDTRLESYIEEETDVLLTTTARKYSSPVPPEWAKPGEYLLTLEPYVADNGVLTIGNSGLIVDIGHSVDDVPPPYKWPMSYKPDSSFKEHNRNIFKNTTVFCSAFIRFLEFYDQLTKENPKYFNAFMVGETNKSMFNFRKRVFDDLAPNSFVKPKQSFRLNMDYPYELDLCKVLNSYTGLSAISNNSNLTLITKLASRARVGEWAMLTSPTSLFGI